MITKKQLLERVKSTHGDIDWLFSPDTKDEEIKQRLHSLFPGVIVVEATRQEMQKMILKNLVFQNFHPGL